MVNLYKPMRLGDDARIKFNQFMDTHADPLFDQLAECILRAASTGASGLEVFVYNADGDEGDGEDQGGPAGGAARGSGMAGPLGGGAPPPDRAVSLELTRSHSTDSRTSTTRAR